MDPPADTDAPRNDLSDGTRPATQTIDDHFSDVLLYGYRRSGRLIHRTKMAVWRVSDTQALGGDVLSTAMITRETSIVFEQND